MTDEQSKAMLQSLQDKEYENKRLQQQLVEAQRHADDLAHDVHILQKMGREYGLREQYMQRAIWYLEDVRADAVTTFQDIMATKKVRSARKIAEAFVNKTWTRQLEMNASLSELKEKA